MTSASEEYGREGRKARSAPLDDDTGAAAAGERTPTLGGPRVVAERLHFAACFDDALCCLRGGGGGGSRCNVTLSVLGGRGNIQHDLIRRGPIHHTRVLGTASADDQCKYSRVEPIYKLIGFSESRPWAVELLTKMSFHFIFIQALSEARGLGIRHRRIGIAYIMHACDRGGNIPVVCLFSISAQWGTH